MLLNSTFSDNKVSNETTNLDGRRIIVVLFNTVATGIGGIDEVSVNIPLVSMNSGLLGAVQSQLILRTTPVLITWASWPAPVSSSIIPNTTFSNKYGEADDTLSKSEK